MDVSKFINSAIGTAIAEIVIAPVCLVKTNIHNNSQTIPETVKEIYQKYGVKGFYSASLIAMSTQIFSTSSKYFMYKTICEKRNCKENTNITNNIFVNNTIGCIFISLITHPLDWIKVNQQMHSSEILKNIIIKPQIMYRGYSKTFIKTIISAPLFFPLQETIRYEIKSLNLPIDDTISASIISSTIATVLMQPLDYLKNRQIYGNSLYETKGFQIYFRGLSLNLLRVVPHFTIVVSVTEYLNSKYILRI